MDATTLITIITMFIVTDTSSEFVKYDGLMDCLKEKREIEKLKDGRRVICGPSLATLCFLVALGGSRSCPIGSGWN